MWIASWNINSVRLRLDQLLRLTVEARPDVICLQETKCPDDKFPARALAEAGYPHQHFHGMKSYNGVAILSRRPFAATGRADWCGREDARHVHATFEDGVELHNFYVPAGGDVPDPEINDKYRHKLDFVEAMTGWLAATRRPDRPLILVGDLNIAPLENDVWSHRQLLNVISHTPAETERLHALKQALDFTDVSRHFHPPEEKLYSWWSYRARDWRASNRGRRLDHIWITPALKPRLRDHAIWTEVRGWAPKPSDHVPVMAELDG